jgi:hypothetical protein
MKKGDTLVKVSGNLPLHLRYEENAREAFALLALINAEFTTDPMSVQCFDLSIVERVRVCVGKRVALVRAAGGES